MSKSLWQQYQDEWDNATADAQRIANYARNINQPVAARAAQLEEAFPHMSPDVVLASAEAGLDDDMVFLLAQEERQALEEDPFYRRVASNLASGAMQTLRGLGSLAHGIWYGGLGRPIDALLTANANRAAKTNLLGMLNPIEFGREFRDVYTNQFVATPLEQQIRAAINGEAVDMRFSGEKWDNFYQQRSNVVTPGTYSADSVYALFDVFGGGEFVEPGTTAYNFTKNVVDIGFELATDPTLMIGKSATAARRAQMVFGNIPEAQRARMLGMVDGPRKTVLPEIQIDNWLSSREGSLTLDWISQTDDFLEIFNRVKNAEAAVLLREATDRNEVASIISRFAGREIRGPIQAPLRVRLGQRAEDLRISRIWEQAEELMPDMPNYMRFGQWTPKWEGIPLNNPTQAVVQFERWMQNWKAPKELTSRLSEDMARAVMSGNRNEAWGIFGEANAALADDLIARGFDKDIVRSLSSIIGGPDFGTGTRQRAYWMEKIADYRTAAGDLNLEILDDDTFYRHVSPHSVVELMDETIMLPNLLEIRRATSQLTRLNNVPGMEVSGRGYRFLLDPGDGTLGRPKGYFWGVHDALWSATTSIWMPLALVTRIAWPMRVTLEEQLRMGASGLDSMFRHPLGYIGWALGNPKKGRLARFLDDNFDVQATGINDILGSSIDESAEYLEAMVRNRPRAYGGPAQPRPGQVPWDAFDMTRGYRTDQKITAMRIGYGKMWRDDVKQRVAEAILAGDNQLDDVFEWFYNSSVRRGMMRTSDDFSELLSTPQGTREWLMSQAEEIRQLTAMDTELIESIATRQIRGINLFTDRLDRKKINAIIREKLEAMEEAGTLHRLWVVPQDVLSGVDQTSTLSRAVNQMFYLLGAVPSNTLSRSPVFRQSYWNEITRLMDFADYDTQRAVLAAAREANLPKAMVDDIAGRVNQYARLSPKSRAAILAAEEAGDVAEVVGKQYIIAMEEMDMLAKTFALQEANTLLYQLSERGQGLAAMRLVFPFGEAWKEIGLTWSRLLSTNPHQLRRAQIYVEGARQSGFFYVDPATDQESYASPFDGIFSNLAGLPENTRAIASSNVQGLNLFASSIIPGVGPVGNLIAGASLPDNTQTWRDVRSLVIPFGSNAYEATDLVDPDTYLKTLVPAWIKKALTAVLEDGWDERSWNSHVADSIRVLQASGEYGGSEAEIRRLSEDAEELARKTLWFRALGQGVLPTGFRVDFQVRADSPEAAEQMALVLPENQSFGKDDGGFLSMSILTSLWHTLNNENGGDSFATTRQFMALFGTDPNNYDLYQWVSGVGTGKTEPLTGRTTDPLGRMWEERHPELIENLPAVVGFFAPVSEDGDLDIGAFIRATETGERYSLTGEQFIIASQKIIGTAIWRETVRQTEGNNSQEAREFRVQRQAWLDENFPYWRMDRPNVGVPQTYSQRQRLEQLEEAVTYQAVLNTPAGAALADYMKERRLALDVIQQEFDDVLNIEQAKTALQRRNSTAGIRSMLRQYGEQIRDEVPEFGPIWERILLSEIGDEEIDQ